MKKFLFLVLALFVTFGLTACEKEEKAATVERLVIVTPATKLEYNLGEELDLAGLSIKAVLSDGVEKNLTSTDYTVTGFDSTITGSKVITITHKNVKVMYTVNVFDPDADKELMSINIKSLPAKQIYKVGEAFDKAGMVVEAVYNTGEKELVTDYTLSGFNSTGLTNTGVISVIYESKVATVSYKVRNTIVQGVTDTKIVVGNTAAVSGPFSTVGVPFNAGIKAYFHKINDAGGVNGRLLEFKSYDDEFNAEKGLNYTKKLVEEDEIFALVGHFGTPTVGATIDYIEQVGVPMVYAATGINSLYFEQSLGNPVMAVQPIYKTDGRIMTARALNESLFGTGKNQKLGANDKIGVLYTADDAGKSIKEGIEVQSKTEGRESSFIYKTFSTTDTAALNNAILDFMSSGVKAVIVASNQAPFKAAVGGLQNNGLHVPVFTSYVNADATSVDPTVNYRFDMYANAWLDIVDPEGVNGFSADYWTFANDMIAAGFSDYAANAYAMAGYIAASIFVEGLNRVGEDTLSWESYIKAMEEGAISVPMGVAVDFSGGKRWGIASMALLKLEIKDGKTAWGKVRDIEDISLIEAK